jgi:hypothetical protein
MCGKLVATFSMGAFQLWNGSSTKLMMPNQDPLIYEPLMTKQIVPCKIFVYHSGIIWCIPNLQHCGSKKGGFRQSGKPIDLPELSFVVKCRIIF